MIYLKIKEVEVFFQRHFVNFLDHIFVSVLRTSGQHCISVCLFFCKISGILFYFDNLNLCLTSGCNKNDPGGFHLCRTDS